MKSATIADFVILFRFDSKICSNIDAVFSGFVLGSLKRYSSLYNHEINLYLHDYLFSSFYSLQFSERIRGKAQSAANSQSTPDSVLC
jgi:hypothetical protein